MLSAPLSDALDDTTSDRYDDPEDGRLSDLFADALEGFTKTLPQSEILSFEGTTLIEIEQEICRIQQIQATKKSLRYMRRIMSFVNGIKRYEPTIEVFVSAKPSLLAFIWGPLKFLLQIASTNAKCFDILLNAFRRIGDALPRFLRFEALFPKPSRFREVLVWLYGDILEFYAEMLKFFRKKGWERLLHTMWSNFDDQFEHIISRIDRHAALVDAEAIAVSFSEACDFRRQARQAFEKAEKDRIVNTIQRLKEWLSPLSFDNDLERSGAIVNNCPYTGDWCLQANEFCAWLDPNSSSSVLWLSGIPGSGKTTMSYIAMKYAKRQLRTSGVFGLFLADRLNGERNVIAAVLRTIIYHLLDIDSRSLFLLLSGLMDDPETDLHSVRFLESNMKLLLSVVEVKPMYMIVDGIDELDDKERKELLKIILRLPDTGTIRILISSRATADVRDQLLHVPQIVANERNGNDILTYVKNQEFHLAELFHIDVTKAEEILRPIAVRSQGMFLYARLVIFNLEGQGTLKQLWEAAEDLPDGLDQAYRNILTRIDKKLGSNASQLAKKVLEFLCCARRPPRLVEIQHAITIEANDSCFSRDRLLRRQLDELCGPILEIRDGFINFVHFTAKEYLLSNESGPYIDRPIAHLRLAVHCLSYLCFSCFGRTLNDNEIAFYINEGEYLFLNYAESHWLEHVKAGSKTVSQEFDLLNQALSNFLLRWWRGNYTSETPEKPSGVDIGFAAFRETFPDVYENLIKIALYKSQRHLGGNIEDPLLLDEFSRHFWGIFDQTIRLRGDGDNRKRMEMLIEFYGNCLFKCRVQMCPYFEKGFASKRDCDSHSKSHERPFKCNVYSCDFSSFGFNSHNALQKHTLNHTAIEADLPNLATLRLDEVPGGFLSRDMNKLLSDAIAADDVSQVIVALENGASPNSIYCRYWGRTTLAEAAGECSPEIVQALIGHGADINYTSGSHTPALSVAARRGSLEIVKLLLKHGAKLDAVSASKDTALGEATALGNLEVVQMLLDFGADINAGARGALESAARTGRLDAALLLLERGASVNGKPSGNIHPLKEAVKGKQTEMVRLLLDHGAKVNDARGKQAYGALSFAAAKGSVEIVKILLDHGAEIDTMIRWRTPLMLAAFGKTAGHAKTVRLLLEAGADPELKGGDGAEACEGAGNISKWLGISWGELVEATRGARS